ncbi:MAG: glutathione S-transferase N-terminal domain-containing protein [Pseudomonadota bacterium]
MAIELWTAPTPNGWKVSIMIEELKALGIALPPLELYTVDLLNGQQFSDAFTAINPNQRIPALRHDGRCIFESGAILNYLGDTFPSSLLPADSQRWQVLPWVYWQVANLGPAFGNKLSYTRYMDDVEPIQKKHPLERFNKEAQRLLGILDTRLSAHDFICGDEYTIADIATWPWVRGWKWSKIDITPHEHVVQWVRRVRARPAVEKGIAYGAPQGESDQWSQETKARYQRLGTSMASNRPSKNKDSGDS